MKNEEIKKKLVEAEMMVDALRRNEIDAIIGEKSVSMIRLREVEERLVEAIKIAEERANELEDFSYSISHDLRGPLNVIKLCVELLNEDYVDSMDETGRDYVQRINSSANKMIDHINHILNLSKVNQHELQKKDVDLQALAERIVADLRQSEPDRKVDISIHQGMNIHGDPKLLDIAMTNLIGNAWKFSSQKEHTNIEVGMEKNEDTPIFFVRDNGVGFDMEQSRELFGSFKRLHPESKFPGTGVGLSIIKRVIENHGGRIWAVGEPDVGATFYFTLPTQADSGSSSG